MKTFSEKPLLAAVITMFGDMIGVGLIVPILAPLFLDPATGVLEPGVPDSIRNLIYGAAAGTFALGQTVGAPVMGALSDRWGRRPVLLVTVGGLAAGRIVLGVAVAMGSVSGIVGGRFVVGILAGSAAILNSVVSDISSGEARTRNFGVLGATAGLAIAVGPAIGGFLGDLGASSSVSFIGYGLPFFAAAALSFINLAFVFFFFPETNAEKDPAAPIRPFAVVARAKEAFTGPMARPLRGAFASFTMIMFFAVFVSLFLVQEHGFTPAGLGMIISLYGAMMVVTQAGLLRVVTRFVKPYHAVVAGHVFLAAVFAGFTLPLPLWGVVVFMALAPMGQGIVYPNMTRIISDMAPPALKGRTMGMYQSVNSMAALAPPFVGGGLAMVSSRLPILAASVMGLVALWLYVRMDTGGTE